MTKQLSISLVFDFPAKLRKLDIFDIGEDKPYFDLDKTRIAFSEWYTSFGRAQFTEILETCQSGKNLSIYLSKNFVDLLADLDAPAINSLKAASESGNLEMLGGLSCPSLSSIYSEEQFKRQVLNHKELLNSLFSVNPLVFYNTENVYFQRLDFLIHSLGFEALFAGKIDWYLSNDPFRRVFQGSNDIKVMLLDNENESAVFNDSPVVNHFFQANSTRLEKFGGVRSIVEKLANAAEIVPLSKQLTSVDPEKQYAIKNPVSGSVDGLSLESFNGNVLQNQVLKQYYNLESKIVATEDSTLIELWDELGHSEYLQSLSLMGDHSGQKTPHDLYNHFRNILTDLELRVKD